MTTKQNTTTTAPAIHVGSYTISNVTAVITPTSKMTTGTAAKAMAITAISPILITSNNLTTSASNVTTAPYYHIFLSVSILVLYMLGSPMAFEVNILLLKCIVLEAPHNTQ